LGHVALPTERLHDLVAQAPELVGDFALTDASGGREPGEIVRVPEWGEGFGPLRPGLGGAEDEIVEAEREGQLVRALRAARPPRRLLGRGEHPGEAAARGAERRFAPRIRPGPAGGG